MIAGLESGEDHLAGLGGSVAVPVDKVENVGGRSDKQPTVPRHEPVGKGKPSGKDRPRIDRSVPVGVGEGDDPSTAVAVGIVAHLGDEQPAIVIPADRHRIEDERFGRHKLHDMPRHDVEAGQRGGRGQWPRLLGSGRGSRGVGGSQERDHCHQPESREHAMHAHRADPPVLP